MIKKNNKATDDDDDGKGRRVGCQRGNAGRAVDCAEENKKGMKWKRLFKSYDIFAKTTDEVTTRTISGGLLTLASWIVMAILLMYECWRYGSTSWRSELVVDSTSRKQQMDIQFDISFPKMPCFAITLDIMDAASEHQTNIRKTVTKHRMDAQGNIIEQHKAELRPKTSNNSLSKSVSGIASDLFECGSCYGATAIGIMGLNCCNSCEEVIAAYRSAGLDLPDDYMTVFEQCNREDFSAMVTAQRTEGCRIEGCMKVNKIPGNFHFAPGVSFQLNNMHAHDLRPFPDDMVFDFSHHIHALTFGPSGHNVTTTALQRGLQGLLLTNPLQDFEDNVQGGEQMYTYFLKVVPTRFLFKDGVCVDTNQYSASQHHRDVSSKAASTSGGGPAVSGGGGLQGAYFNLEISPMMLTYHESSPSFSSFLTNCCAIIGGIYTLATLLDSIIYSAEKRYFFKQSLGKAT